jgi:methyl-accepting chemotaxis protein
MTATRDVGTSIHAIQDSTRHALARMDEAAGVVAEAASESHRSGEALKEIVLLSEQSAAEIQAIAAASEQQSATSEQIARTFEEISRISSSTAEAMERSSLAVLDLSRQSQGLQALIAELKTSR